MSYDVIALKTFQKEAKRLVKKYPSLKKELADLIAELKLTPTIGTPLGSGVFKVRISIASKGKGKSGGGRVITFVKMSKTRVYLLSIYDKSEEENISDQELESLPKEAREIS